MKNLQHNVCTLAAQNHTARRTSRHKERQARAGVMSGRTYGESNSRGSQEFFKKELLYLKLPRRIQRSMGCGGWKGVGVRRRVRKRFRSLRCGYGKRRNFHGPFARSCCLCHFSLQKRFSGINFRSLTRLRKFSNSENFPTAKISQFTVHT